MDKKELQKKLSRTSFINTVKEGLSFSDYFDDSVPYEQKPPEMIRPMQEDDYPIQAKNLFKGLWETESVLRPYNDYWMDSDNKFHHAPKGHTVWGETYLSSHNISYDIGNSVDDVYTAMFQLQFIRVKVRYNVIYFEHGPENPPTNSQLRELKNQAIESHMKLIDATARQKEIDLLESSRILPEHASYWLDPDGNFHDAGYEGHLPFADRYLANAGVKVGRDGYYAEMYKRKWVRVYVETPKIHISYSMSMEPTNVQWRVLKDSAIESGFEIWDDNYDRPVELQEGMVGKSLFIEHMMPEDMESFKSHLAQLFAYLQKELQLKTVPKVKLVSDEKNAAKVLGKTAYYEPETRTVHLYTTGRHQKDILRSFSHEVVHHWQHENEKLQTTSKNGAKGESPSDKDPQYAQNNPWLRQMEKQAYLLGNIMFRDWEDQKKAKDRKSQKKMVEVYRERIKKKLRERTYILGKEYPPKKADYRG